MKLHPIVLALGVIQLAGCGGSSSGSEDSSVPSQPVTYSVKAIDGYLNGAQVWLDLNSNFMLDGDEPQAISTTGGVAVLAVDGISNPEQFPVVVKAIAGTTIDEDTMQPVASSYLLSAPAGETVVTPISTLVHIKMTTQSLSLTEAKELVATDLNLESETLLDDYIATAQGEAAAKANALVELGVLPSTEQALQQSHQDATAIDTALETHAETVKQLAENERVIKAEDGTVEVVANIDTDQDGIIDAKDAFPTDKTEWSDQDRDGVGDNSDAFPNNAAETKDTDQDGVGDNSDAFPTDANETLDSDNDGVGDNQDAFPNNAAETKDTDQDGVGDNSDAFPTDANEILDSDNDGVGDNQDAFPNNAAETKDTDQDGVGDNSDAFPSDATETTDSDLDGIGDVSDQDDDNDGYLDEDDTDPLTPLSHPENYRACLDSLEDADYVRQVGDTLHYNSQKEVAWVDNGNRHSYTESFAYHGDTFSWLNNLPPINDLPDWITQQQGKLTKVFWTGWDESGRVIGHENSYELPKTYLGNEGADAKGRYAGYGSMRSTIVLSPDSSEHLLNQSIEYQVQNKNVATLYSSPEGTSFEQIPYTDYKVTERYLGKDIVRVPMGLFETCKLETRVISLDENGNEVGTDGEADVSIDWSINRGLIMQEQRAPSWAPFYDRQATGFTQDNAAAYLQQNPQFYFFEMGNDVGYDLINWDSTTMAIPYSSYVFDHNQLSFQPSNSEEKEYVLTGQGWQNIAAFDSQATLTPESDGSLSYQSGADLEAERGVGFPINLSQVNINSLLYQYQGYGLAQLIDGSAQFQPGATALEVTWFTQERYELWQNNQGSQALFDIGNNSIMVAQGQQSAIQAATSLVQLIVNPVATEYPNSADFMGIYFDQYGYQFYPDGTGAAFESYQNENMIGMRKVSSNIRWQVNQVQGKDIMTISVDDASWQFDSIKRTFFTVIDGYVRLGEYTPAQTEKELIFNVKAGEDILNNIIAP